MDKEKSLLHKGHDFSSLAITYSTNMFAGLQEPSNIQSEVADSWHSKTQYMTVCESTLEQVGFLSSFAP